MAQSLHSSYQQIKADVEQLGSHLAEAASAAQLPEKVVAKGKQADAFARQHVWWLAASATLLGFILGHALRRHRQ